MQTVLDSAVSGKRRGFLCAGCWTLDRVKIVDNWPAEDSLARIIEIDRQGGGSAHNVGVGLKRIDSMLPVEGIGLLGHDADGDFLINRAAQYGIDTAQMHQTHEAATSFTDVMSVQSTGRRTFFHHTGTNDLLTPDWFDLSNTTMCCLHLGLLGLHAQMDAPWESHASGWVAVLSVAQQAGIETSIELVSIDAGRIRELATPCLPFIDKLIVNDQEIGALANIDTMPDGVACPERCLQAAQTVCDSNDIKLVAVHYPKGAIAIDAHGNDYSCPSLAMDPEQIGGSVGAGDAFASGMLYALHEGWSIDKAMQLGHAVAASSLKSSTAVESIGTLEDCLTLVNSNY